MSAPLLALLPAGPANAEDDEDDEDDEEERKKILPRPVSLGLKAIVVAGTLYALAELYTAPKIETETRRGEEATGERVLLCLCPCLSLSVCLIFSISQSPSIVSPDTRMSQGLAQRCHQPSHSYVSRPHSSLSNGLIVVCLTASFQFGAHHQRGDL